MRVAKDVDEPLGVIAKSTPTFMIGTQKYEGLNWATLVPKLRAAGLN